MAKGSNFQTDLLKRLKDPKFAANYVMAAIEENDAGFLAQALSDVVKAHGTSKIAKASHLTRQALYKMLSPKGNPTLQSVNSVLGAVGLRVSIEPKKKKSA
jgi:probable addiction module antidote protein